MTKEIIIEAFKKKGYVYEPEKVNLFGVRTSYQITDKFDDFIGLIFNDLFYLFQGTTDPGKFYSNNPIDGKRTAIMKEGQVVDCYEIGLHKSRYEALRQCKPMPFFQDTDRDDEIDTNMKVINQLIYANIHGTRDDIEVWRIGKFSAACQVIKRWIDFQDYIKVCKDSKQKFFTYTLLNINDL
jgi:hypothetical protein